MASKPRPCIVLYFTSESALKSSFKAITDKKYSIFEVYSPVPLKWAASTLHTSPHKLNYIAVAGGLTGMALGFFGQMWISTIAYPLFYGGKPFFALPSFVPVMFESTLLLASLATVISMFLKTGLGAGSRNQPLHPEISGSLYALAVETPVDTNESLSRLLNDLPSGQIAMEPQIQFL